MFVETIFRIAAWGSWRPTLSGMHARPVLQLEAREVDVLHLDLAGPQIRHATVLGHWIGPLSDRPVEPRRYPTAWSAGAPAPA